jgi:hypothetical protein
VTGDEGWRQGAGEGQALQTARACPAAQSQYTPRSHQPFAQPLPSNASTAHCRFGRSKRCTHAPTTPGTLQARATTRAGPATGRRLTHSRPVTALLALLKQTNPHLLFSNKPPTCRCIHSSFQPSPHLSVRLLVSSNNPPPVGPVLNFLKPTPTCLCASWSPRTAP